MVKILTLYYTILVKPDLRPNVLPRLTFTNHNGFVNFRAKYDELKNQNQLAKVFKQVMSAVVKNPHAVQVVQRSAHITSKQRHYQGS